MTESRGVRLPAGASLPRRRILWHVVAIAAALFIPGTTFAVPRPTVKAFLQQKAGFSSDEISRIESGEAVARILETDNGSEVVVLGAVRVNVSRAAFLETAKDVRRFKTAGVLQMGILGDPPTLADFDKVSLPSDDLRDLEKCKPRDCKLKLPLKRMTDFRDQVDWESADPGAQADPLVRQALFNAINAYLKGGSAAFAPLVDKDSPVSPGAQFQALLQDSPYLLAFFPDLFDYLKRYPNATLPGSSSIFYWADENFGLRPTLTLNQAVTYAPAGTDDAVVAWKQIYASHYFNGSLALTFYASDPGAAYLVHLEQARLDGFGGWLGGIYRGKVEKSVKARVVQFLEGAEQKVKAGGAHP